MTTRAKRRILRDSLRRRRRDSTARRCSSRCTHAADTGGVHYHAFKDCPLGGLHEAPHTAAAFCMPIDEEPAESMHALALSHLSQAAADDGPDAFAAAAGTHGPPAVLTAFDAPGGIAVSIYGFIAGGTVHDDAAAGSAGADVSQDLYELSYKMDALGERLGMSFWGASFPHVALEQQPADGAVVRFRQVQKYFLVGARDDTYTKPIGKAHPLNATGLLTWISGLDLQR
ncbi:hypothetical protein CYMTET_25157 [Cymbomonas tetramitiformis]|uniref:Uncharacterized protein n=1 Tax=Cymbomonas tetramitiformis TaxID=36881 RepID=A0AAE0FUE7_9CHLO|nr:hypothetical protein CYMTET_25157 [Cymbomonas tetramitiformis]